MIAKMKKVRVLGLAAKRQQLTQQLGKLGAIHIETREASSSELDTLKENQTSLQRALQTVPESKNSMSAPAPKDLDEALSKAKEILEAAEKLKDISDSLERVNREIARVRPWGDFSPQLVRELEEKGLNFTFGQVNADQMKAIPEDIPYIVVHRTKDRSLLIFLSASDELVYEAFRLPEFSLSELEGQRNELESKHAAASQELSEMQMQRSVVEQGLELQRQAYEFSAVEASLNNLDGMDLLCQVSGFIPDKRLHDLKQFAQDAGTALIIEEPSDEDPVPTKIENPRAIGIIKPVFDFMGTVPGYKEQDISFWFLIFFTIFFAMIIGDAGYGSLLSIAAITLSVKAKAKSGRVPDALILFDILSLTTVVWGAVTGNWFGYGPIADLPVLRSLVIPSLDSFAVENSDSVTKTVQFLCFAIGLVHLVIAHTLAFIKKIRQAPHIHAFADLGWMATIIGLFFLVLNVVISMEQYPVPSWAIYLIGGGIGVVFLFSGQQGDGFFRGVLRALADIINTALSGVSAFADVISYIRLFAVGLASIEIAKSFNDMAMGMMDSGIGGIIGGILVLALGHSLNLVMGALSVVVHGIRLKMLEFSSHLGNEWAGFEYKPFKTLATYRVRSKT